MWPNKWIRKILAALSEMYYWFKSWGQVSLRVDMLCTLVVQRYVRPYLSTVVYQLDGCFSLNVTSMSTNGTVVRRERVQKEYTLYIFV